MWCGPKRRRRGRREGEVMLEEFGLCKQERRDHLDEGLQEQRRLFAFLVRLRRTFPEKIIDEALKRCYDEVNSLFAQEVTESGDRVLRVFNELMLSLIPDILSVVVVRYISFLGFLGNRLVIVKLRLNDFFPMKRDRTSDLTLSIFVCNTFG